MVGRTVIGDEIQDQPDTATVERCPGECIYLEPDSPQTDTADAEIIDI